MRQLLLLCWVTLLPFLSFSQQDEIPLIPKPNKMVYGEGSFSLSNKTSVYVSEGFSGLTSLLSEYPNLKTSTPELVKKINKKHNHGIRLFQTEDADKLAPNAYRITIDPTGVLIKAPNEQIMRSALMTFLQIGLLQNNPLELPAVTIEDSPRFNYRGLHLDVSRHFMPLSFIKKYIDIMALYKFNYFHWHLTDGAGWRLEIKKYPELTSKAAWRTHTNWLDWYLNGRHFLEQGDPNAYGGFYTQEQVKDVVAYAAQKGVTIIPEIEFPGHSEEVLAVYPHLSCAGAPYSQDEFCIGNPETFTFIKNVLDEVLTLFPSEYIHIGGDEANKKHWEKCPKCQALKQKENLKDENELQSYGIRQLDEYLQSKNRKLIGWDEILEGGLTKGATVMSWRGEEGGIKAANAGHDVIMTPQSPLYFDSYQTDPRNQPIAFGGFVSIDQVYAYNPVPKAVDKDKEKHILGAQANLWTEYMPTYQQVEYMAFPRALALAEVNWTNQNNRSWEDFKGRLQKHYKLLQQLDVNYYRPSYKVQADIKFHPDRLSNTVSLKSEQINPLIYYTTDGSEPTHKSTIYTNPIELPGSLTLRAASFIDSARVSPIEDFQLDVHKAIGKKVFYNNPWSNYPAQKESTLTNGTIGGINYSDQQWQGFTQPIDLYVDFERREEIKSVAMRFMQLHGPGIYFPGTFKVLVSDNGKNYRELGEVVNHDVIIDAQLKFQRFELKLEKPVMARYVRIQATNPKKGFLFTDELIIY